MNRLQLAAVCRLYETIRDLAEQQPVLPLIIIGNQKFFSVGADLNEILALGATNAVQFSRTGQKFTDALDDFPALTIATISGYGRSYGPGACVRCAHCGAECGFRPSWRGARHPDRLGRNAALAAAYRQSACPAAVSGSRDGFRRRGTPNWAGE